MTKSKIIAIVHYPLGNVSEDPKKTNKAFAYEAVQDALNRGEPIMLPSERDAAGNRLWDVDLHFFCEEIPEA